MIHASLLRNGKILAIGGSQANCCYTWGKIAAYLYDPLASGNKWTSVGGPYDANSDAFCSGQAHDNLGRVVYEGGLQGYCSQNGRGIAKSARYDLSTGSWTNLSSPPSQYYPTVAAGTDRMWMFPGTPPYAGDGNHISGNFWSGLYQGIWLDTGVVSPGCATYPRAHLLPDGRFLFSSPKGCHPLGDLKNYFYDPATNTTSPAGGDNVPDDGGAYIYDGFHNSSVLLPFWPYQGGYDVATVMITDGQSSTYFKKDAYWCPADGGSSPCWQSTEARPTDTVWEPHDPHNSSDGDRWVTFPTRRTNGIATILPTGQVVVSGGISGADEGGPDTTHVKTPEVYGTDAGLIWINQWFLTNPATVTRNYHSVALLLPDGRIWTAGSNKDGAGSYCAPGSWCCGGSTDERQEWVEYFVPWYYGRPDRPTVTCPANMSTNGGLYTLGIGNASGHDIDKVALMRAGSMTHALDVDQRLVWLDISNKYTAAIDVRAPYTTAAAPPGDYMLFALRHNGTYGARIPSVACWTKR